MKATNNEAMEELVTAKSIVKSDLSNLVTFRSKFRIESHCLSEHGLLLFIKPEEKPFPVVPPSTPKELISDCYITTLPEIPDSLKDIHIPYVRERGIRDSIGALAKYFHCDHFRNNLVQFWFLDMLVDCIWRAQDEYKFSLQDQKVMLEWILFVIKLIKGHNMTKNLMFEIFNEALTIAENYVQSGGAKAPTPNALFHVELEETEEVDANAPYSFMSLFNQLETKSSDVLNNKPPNQYVVVKLEENVQVFKVPNNETVMEDCLSSSIDPPSEHELGESNYTPSDIMKQEEAAESDVSLEFYKPNMATPSRFRSLQDIEVIMKQDSESLEQKVEVESVKSVREWLNIPRKQTSPECPSQIVREKIDLTDLQPNDMQMGSTVKVREQNGYKQESSIDTQSKKNEQPVEEIELVLDKENLFKIYYDYNMWQLKNEYMADPRIGWTPSLTSYKNIFKTNKLKTNSKTKSAFECFKTKADVEREKHIFVNMCILMAVKQIVFEYFNYNFSFELVKTSLKYPQYLITQDINTFWNIPKDIKGEIKKPVPKKPKKEKHKKEKAPKGKKDKSSKKDKSTKSSKGKSKEKKGKEKKGKEKKGKEKKGKDKKTKSDKASKASKKSEKDKKMSKDEKKEMDRLKKELEDIDRQKIKEEENKMFMFPLKEAVDDNFFMKLFPDFKSKKPGKKGDKKHDKKSDKSSKKTKSDKSSKKGKKKK